MAIYNFTTKDKKIVIDVMTGDQATEKQVYDQFKKIQKEYFPTNPHQEWVMTKKD